VSAIDQSLLVARHEADFHGKRRTRFRVRREGGGKGNNQNKRCVGGVEGRRRIGGPVDVAGARPYARGVANGELERCGLPPSGGE
jgi:hypothetical protein